VSEICALFRAAKDANPLADYCRRLGLRLTQTSTGFSAKCPLHKEEKGQSFAINGRTERWRCFGKCDQGGDVIDLHTAINGISQREAAIALASASCGDGRRTTAPKSSPPSKPAPRNLTTANEEEFSRARSNLSVDADLANEIAQSRHWGAETIQALAKEGCLGAAKDGDDFLLYFRYPRSIKVRRGIREGEKRVWWQAGGPQGACYRSDRIREHIRTLIVPEGEVDVITAIDGGWETENTLCVGLPSASCGELDLRPFVGRDVILCLDNDDAGRKATQRLAQSLYELVGTITIRSITCACCSDLTALRTRHDNVWQKFLEDRTWSPQPDARDQALFSAKTGAGQAPQWQSFKEKKEAPRVAQSSQGTHLTDQFSFKGKHYPVRTPREFDPHSPKVSAAENWGKQLEEELLAECQISQPAQRLSCLKRLVVKSAPLAPEWLVRQMLEKQYRTAHGLTESEKNHVEEGVQRYVEWNGRFERSRTVKANDRRVLELVRTQLNQGPLLARAVQIVHALAHLKQNVTRGWFPLSGDMLAFRLGFEPFDDRHKIGDTILHYLRDLGLIVLRRERDSTARRAREYSLVSLEPRGQSKPVDHPFYY
jgi:hypothetical protein